MTTSPRPRVLLAAVAAFAGCTLLAGCGGSGGSATPAAAGGGNGASNATSDAATDATTDANAGDVTGNAPDPCTLVSAADLSAAYGVSFGEGANSDTDVAGQRGFRACKWEDGSGTKSFLLQTVASGEPLGQSASDLFDQSKALYPDATDGTAGDESILLSGGGGFLAVSGDVFVQGNAIIFGADTPADASATILQTVVGAL